MKKIILCFLVLGVIAFVLGCKAADKMAERTVLMEDVADDDGASSEETEISDSLDELQELDEMTMELDEEISFDELDELKFD